MFRALVAASALLTATLAAVLFMPGVGRSGAGAEQPAIASTGDLARKAEALSGLTEEAPVELAAPLQAVEMHPVEALVSEVMAQDDPPFSAEDALAAVAVLQDDEAEAALAEVAVVEDSAPVAEPVAEVAESNTSVSTPGDPMRAMSAGVLAGLGLELAEPVPAPAPKPQTSAAYPALSARASVYASQKAVSDSSGWSTDYVLIGLGKGPRKVTTPLEEAQEWSTQYVLNGLTAGVARVEPVMARRTGPVELEQVIAEAIQEGRSDEYLVALIEQLSAAGQLDAPAALLRPDGQVDSALVLNALVSASTVATRRQAPTPRPERRLTKSVVYTVRAGDSLAAIAYRFYGQTSRYTDIFEANRVDLPSPDSIRAGQRLTIPAG